MTFFGSGFGEPGDTPPPRIPRSIPPSHPRAALKQTIIVGGRNDCLVCQVDTSDIRGSTTRFQPTYRKPHVYDKITLFVFVLNLGRIKKIGDRAISRVWFVKYPYAQ